MSTITAVNAFIGKTEAPTQSELTKAIGAKSRALWDELVHDIGEQTGATVQEWNSFSPKYGWSLRLKRAKRNIVYFIPLEGGFQVAFTLGEKAIKAAHDAGLSAKIMRIIDTAPQYPEGTGFRLDIERADDLPVIKTLAMIKMKN